MVGSVITYRVRVQGLEFGFGIGNLKNIWYVALPAQWTIPSARRLCW